MPIDAASERAASNPFTDSPAASDISSVPPHPTAVELDGAAAVLVVDRNATLTLGTDSLILLDEGLRDKRSIRNGCGLLPQRSKTTRPIPFYNILWAELTNSLDVVISYAHMTGKSSCRPAYIHYSVMDKTQHDHVKRWVAALMNRAYPHAVKRQKRVKALVNPFGGQGYAPKMWAASIEPIFAAAKMKVDVEQTTSQGHGVDIAQNLDIDAYDVVACASGDGLPHEVFNGLAKHKEARRALRKIAVVQLPCGTGNAMSLNLNGTVSPSLAALAIVKGVPTPMDLMAITQGDSLYYSFLSQSLGIIAESDLGTESLRWMGNFRFTWGILVRLLSQTVYPATVSVADSIDDKAQIRKTFRQAVEQHAASSSALTASDTDSTLEDSQLPALKYGTVNDPLPSSFSPPKDLPDLGNFYVGNMCWMSSDAAFFSSALPADGKMDMMNISAYTSRWTAIKMLATVGQGTIMNLPQVHYCKVRAYRIHPRVHQPPKQRRWVFKLSSWLGGSQRSGQTQASGRLIAVDGEKVPFEPFQVEVVPSLGTVLSKRGAVYEFDPTAFLASSSTGEA